MSRDELGRCWPWLERAIAKGRDAGLTRDQLAARLRDNTAQLWPGERSAMVTTLEAKPAGRFLHVWLGAGDLAELLSMRPGVEAWGRQQGCDFVSIDGRPGWGRALRRHGFVRVGEELVKTI